MDRSFLSDPRVVAAARDFVCVRLVTYENADEGKLLGTLFRTRSGELENTTFTILSSDARRSLVRSGRSPAMVFRDADEMADAMERIVREEGSADGKVTEQLPVVESVRLAVNVAACDQLPLVIAVSANEDDSRRLQEQLTGIAFGQEFRGRFLYTTAQQRDELTGLDGVPASFRDGVVVVQPDSFGVTGEVIGVVEGVKGDADRIPETLRKVAAELSKPAPQDRRRHVRQGRQQGVEWESAIPVTDPHSVAPPHERRRPPDGGKRRGARDR